MNIKSIYTAPLAKLPFATLLGIGLVLAAGQASAAEYWLCAKAGSVTINAENVPIWGYVQDTAGFAGNCAAAPALPGPALTVDAGDASGLTVHVRNLLPEGTSIVIPGLSLPQPVAGTPTAPVLFTDGTGRQRVRSFVHETAPNGTADYIWSSVKAGTYLYHSGSHPQVQVQMGLYGSLTKNFTEAVPAAPPAAAVAAAAYEGVSYDASLTLLFSEIDPAQHAAIAAGTYGTAGAPATVCLDTDGSPMPMTSTLCYKPKYFLLNGKPFQVGDPVLATVAPGQNTLLRMLNAGYRTYVPLVQGTHMKMIAEDGNRYQYRDTTGMHARDQYQYSTWMPALKTNDAIIAPTAEGKYPIYDRRLNTVTANQDGGMFGVLQVGATSGADLAISKTNGQTSYALGAVSTYTIVVNNVGADTVTGARVTDNLPAALTAARWTCASTATPDACGAATGIGNITDTLGALAGGQNATYTLTATVGTASGNLVNTASVSMPAGVTDANPVNNSASDTDTPPAAADLGVTIANGVAPVISGNAVQYSIVVSNNGPAAVTGALASNTFNAAQFSAYSWSCTATAGSSCAVTGGNNAFTNLPVNLLPGGSATFAVNATISATATGNLVNSASVAAPVGITDANAVNNSATDTDAISAPQANLVITKTDGLTSVVAGGSLTYTIVVSNAGPSAVTGALVNDTMPASLTGVTWTCAAAPGSLCPSSTGSGSIVNRTVTLPSGGSVTFLVKATVSPSASDTLSNTATVAVPAGVTELDAANNSATDTTTLLAASADLSVTNTDGVTTPVTAGTSVLQYTIVVRNAGPSLATGATVSDPNTGLTNVSWTCVATAGSTCTLPLGTNAINTTVNLAVNGTATFVVNGTVNPFQVGNLVNTATVTSPAGVTDPAPGNNSASDTDTVLSQANLAITKTDGVTQVLPGAAVTYTIVASNAGPSGAANAGVNDSFPAAFTGATWTCTATAGSACPASGSGSIAAVLVTLAPSGSATFTVNGTVDANATTGTNLVNTATVTAPAGVTDSNSANNTATDTDAIVPPLPAVGLLDNFNRVNANNLGANWGQAGTGTGVDIRVNANQAFANEVNNGGQAIWSPAVFGATQTAAFAFATGNAAQRNNSALIFKATGGTVAAPTSFVRVLFQTANGGQVVIQTTANGAATFTTVGTLDNANSNFANGNVMTARVLNTGVVQVWKTTATGTVFVGNVTLPANALWTTGGGRIGVKFGSIGARVDNFSGN